jgi:hypothetical protein
MLRRDARENDVNQFHPLWLALLLLVAGVATAGTPADRDLIAADAARVRALVAADVEVLGRVLADDVSYGHTNGRMQGKHELLEWLQSGRLRYRSLATEDVAARAYGCAGVVTGKAVLQGEYQGQALAFGLRYTATYARRHDHWVLVAYQSVRLPDAAPAPAPAR